MRQPFPDIWKLLEGRKPESHPDMQVAECFHVDGHKVRCLHRNHPDISNDTFHRRSGGESSYRIGEGGVLILLT